MLKELLTYFDYRYFLRFAILYGIFYAAYMGVMSVSAPTGIYWPFVDHYLNFPQWIRDVVLICSQGLLSLLGYGTSIQGAQIISADGRQILEMAWPCYGLGVKSFWAAFVLAHTMPIGKKMLWTAIGITTVFLLNCIRVTAMMIAGVNGVDLAKSLGTDNHDLFNYVCYGALALLIFLFYRNTGNKSTSPLVPTTKQTMMGAQA